MKTFFLLLAALSMSTWSRGAGVLLESVKGTVDVRKDAAAEWIQGLAGTEIPEGATVRTGKDGRAKITFPNKSVVWLKPDTSLLVKEKKDLATRLSLLLGAIKVRVPHLRRKEKFDIDTPSAVAGVRGTVLALETDGKGKDAVDVLFGEARFQKKGKQPVKAGKQAKDWAPVKVAQGFSYDGTKLGLLAPEREKGGLEDWAPQIADDQRVSELRDFLAARAEVRSFGRAASATEREQAEIRDRVKSEDFAASRTLVDVHGNLVRLEQRFDRPDPDSLQLLNVVKRTEYQSGGFRRWDYNGSSGSRLDVLKVRVEFNEALPDTLAELPGFFSSNDNLKMDHSEVIFANASDKNSIFMFGLFAERNATTDAMDAGLWAGTLGSNAADGSAGHQLVGLRELNGTLNVSLTDPSEKVAKFDPVGFASFDTNLVQYSTNGDLWGSNATLWVLDGVYQANISNPSAIVLDKTNSLWLCSELFVINNKGSVYNIHNMIGSNYGPKDFFTDTAVELGFFLKENNLTGSAPTQVDAGLMPDPFLTNIKYDNPGNKNIDLVITPDIFVSMAKSLAPAAGAIGN